MLHVEVVLRRKYANALFQSLILHVKIQVIALQGKGAATQYGYSCIQTPLSSSLKYSETEMPLDRILIGQ